MQNKIAKNNETIKKLETKLIGSLLTFPEKIPSIITQIEKLENYNFEYQIIRQSFIDKKNPSEELVKKGRNAYEFCEGEIEIPSKRIVRELEECYRKGKLIKILLSAQDEIDKPANEVIEKMQDGLVKLYQPEESNEAKEILTEIEKEQEEYAVKYSEGLNRLGLETGFSELDETTDGIRAGHFWVIGAYTSSGKTFFSLNVANNLLNQGKRVVFFSLEMSRSEILQRLMSISLGITPQKLIKGYLDNDLYERLKTEKERVKKLLFTVYDKAFRVETIQAVMRAEHLRKPVDLFVIDYLQNIAGEGKEYEMMTNLSRDLFETAKTMEVPVLALSQMSNESVRSNSNVIGFKGSGGIASTADVGVEMQRKDSEVIFNIRKNRHGITKMFTMGFTEGRFYEKSIYDKK